MINWLLHPRFSTRLSLPSAERIICVCSWFLFHDPSERAFSYTVLVVLFVSIHSTGTMEFLFTSSVHSRVVTNRKFRETKSKACTLVTFWENPNRYIYYEKKKKGSDGPIDNRDVNTEKKLASWKATFVSLDWSWLLVSENPDGHSPKKRTGQPGDAFEDTAFKPRFDIVCM